MEVERKVVGACDKDGTVGEADGEGADVRADFEESQRHDWVAGKFPFVDHEETADQDTEDNETYDGSRIPRVGDTTKFETKEKHKCPADDCKRASPVDCFQTFPDWCLWVVKT